MTRKTKSTDPDILATRAALQRAARAARKLAEATRTPLYVIRNGRIVNLNPNARRTPKSSATASTAQRMTNAD